MFLLKGFINMTTSLKKLAKAGTTLCALILSGCVSQADIQKSLGQMYNVPTSGISQFDKTKFIRVSKMFCSNIVAFGLYQDTSKHNRGTILLDAGTKTITNIGKGKALHIKIDGKTHSFESIDIITEHDKHFYDYGVTTPFSHKTFVIPEPVIREIASSKEFLVKLNLLNNSYVEGKCSPETLTLSEYKEANQVSLWSKDVTQEHINTANKITALYGFRQSVTMMDSTTW
jgi:hypothetical protein